MVLSFGFCLLVLWLWTLDVGHSPEQVGGALAEIRVNNSLARASQPSEFMPLLDPEIMRGVPPERLKLIYKQMKKEKKRVERNGRH